MIEGEIRSLNHETAMELWKHITESSSRKQRRLVRSWSGKKKLNIHAYETPLTSDAARHYESAVAEEGLTAAFEKTFGGSDNNVFAQHGIEGLVIATSMNQVHSCAEYTKIPEIAQVARIVANLAAPQEARTDPGRKNRIRKKSPKPVGRCENKNRRAFPVSGTACHAEKNSL